MDQETRDVFDCPQVLYFDIFLNTLELLEKALGAKALREPGYSRHFTISRMDKRVDAIHFSLEHDDGIRTAEYDKADIILVGVSRSGKTPVSIYLATHMELKAANFPLTADHLDQYELPKDIVRNRQRVVGLTSSPCIFTPFGKNATQVPPTQVSPTVRENCSRPSSFSSVMTLGFSMSKTAPSKKLLFRPSRPSASAKNDDRREGVSPIALRKSCSGSRRPDRQVNVRPECKQMTA
jgi:hypothetical protein